MSDDDYYITATGQRRLRSLGPGELDRRVRAVCVDFVKGELEVEPPLTVTKIRASLLARHGRPVTYNGVESILRRWGRIGAAVIDEGPVQFVEFTPAVAAKGFRRLGEEYAEFRAARLAGASGSVGAEAK